MSVDSVVCVCGVPPFFFSGLKDELFALQHADPLAPPRFHLSFTYGLPDALPDGAALHTVRGLDSSGVIPKPGQRLKKHLVSALRAHGTREAGVLSLGGRSLLVDITHGLHAVLVPVVESFCGRPGGACEDSLLHFLLHEVTPVPGGPRPPTPWPVVVALWRCLDLPVALVAAHHPPAIAVCVDCAVPAFKGRSQSRCSGCALRALALARGGACWFYLCYVVAHACMQRGRGSVPGGYCCTAPKRTLRC